MLYFETVYSHFREALEIALDDGVDPESVTPSVYLFWAEEQKDKTVLSIDVYPLNIEYKALDDWNRVTQEYMEIGGATGYVLFFGVGAYLEEQSDSFIFVVYDDTGDGDRKAVVTTAGALDEYSEFNLSLLTPNLGYREH